MAAIFIWLATIGIGLGLLVVTAMLKKLAFQAFVCALISMNFSMLALREHERRITTPLQQLNLMATNATYLGCNWLWMSLAIIVLHIPKLALTGATSYAIAGLAAAALCLCFSRLIRQAALSRPDRIGNYLRLAGFMALVQFISAFVTLVALTAHSLHAGDRFDWPSLNVIAFSSVALAIISGRALLTLVMGITEVRQVTRPQPAVQRAPARTAA